MLFHGSFLFVSERDTRVKDTIVKDTIVKDTITNMYKPLLGARGCEPVMFNSCFKRF